MNATTETEDLLPEYHQVVNVTLDEDVAKVFFTTADAVNQALRAILTALPKQIATT